MSTLTVTCDQCGTSLEVPEEASLLTCTACSSELTVTRCGSTAYTEVRKVTAGGRTDQNAEDAAPYDLIPFAESVDEPYRTPADLPQGVLAVAVPSRKPFPGIWGAIALCLVFLAAQIVGGVVYGIVLTVLGGPQAAAESIAVAIGPINMAAFAVTMLLGLAMGGLRWSQVVRLTPFRGALLLPIVIATVGIGILTSELDNISRFILPMPDAIARLFTEMVSGGLGMAIVLMVVAPLTEELLFRGLILRGLMQRYGTVWAVLLSTLLFALIHLNPYQFVSVIPVAFSLAWLFVRTRSLWPCIIVHALFNSHVILLPILRDTLGLHIRGFTETIGEGPVVFQPLWFNAIGLVLVGLGVWTTALLTSPWPPPPAEMLRFPLFRLIDIFRRSEENGVSGRGYAGPERTSVSVGGVLGWQRNTF